ncbi:diaminopimelate epimerase [candidate division WOR-1 bacterium RIFOXYA12_FULL_43_27]|uniref:Diaminopimelate epimerase n=1 Tax=candidate division WOR-1 bacterium RIFOXYC2_FULL_46_14 TaxID=1802587 RepID=A0A1F4U5I9_UNCSA|nr:MAG: diaminopimelate epimerase [candidate division WOR-1 bacterium RIFOXYA12_FULL_43_27]OGC20399.1 MAG: diaminopimelate epimerase [candidate division WOR-1 bacterium RIFOXYB2_FULL_46_45]OGC31864.1 MAG: diaminopimelate epimerase [candidate division WOR-1 bacterium RIFOXYA2_FULL_46_56]OGC40245.1 MAG: diaminopimelate epimerase [candidate division WOR-1 bacterium RIFOXYC2_FULL_46_14]
MKFTKMHGLGNDFVLVDCRCEKLEGIDLPQLAEDVCDRNFGIGADGLILVLPSDKADARMQIFNPDGSEPEMCGNGIRCFAKYLYDTMENKKELLSVETKAGIMLPAVMAEKGQAAAVEVDMGIPQILNTYDLVLSTYDFKIHEVSMGNPHAVIFVDDLDAVNLQEVGPKIENHPHFPNRTNVEFVKIIDRKHIEVKVWERGAGETLACGTGACAAVAAAVTEGKTDQEVIVTLPGGNLDIEWNRDDKHILMRGPAETVFTGEYTL